MKRENTWWDHFCVCVGLMYLLVRHMGDLMKIEKRLDRALVKTQKGYTTALGMEKIWKKEGWL